MSKSKQKAIALKYPEWADAPFITVNEKGLLAEKVISIAKENNIPVIESPETADILSLSEAGSMIPEETYAVLAEIFAFIHRLDME